MAKDSWAELMVSEDDVDSLYVIRRMWPNGRVTQRTVPERLERQVDPIAKKIDFIRLLIDPGIPIVVVSTAALIVGKVIHLF